MYLGKNHYKEWKKDFISYENISGLTGESEAMTMLIFKRMSMIETVVSKNMPLEIKLRYEHKQRGRTTMVHEATSHFVSIADNKTLIEVDSEVTEVKGVFMKMVLKLMAGAGKKYSQQQLDQFKVFAESTV
jgi:hypothetical protein